MHDCIIIQGIVMNRPTFKTIYMNLAKDLAKRSTCRRLQVGAVITSTDFRKVLAVGYNGNAIGFDNTCDQETPGACGCLHGEDNAIINCDSPRSTEKFIFVTHLPCPICAKRIINLGGVKKVFFELDYRLNTAKEYFNKAQIDFEVLNT